MFSQSVISWMVAASVMFTSIEAVGDIHLHAAEQGESIVAMDDIESVGELECGECACLSGHQFGIEISHLRLFNSITATITANQSCLLSSDRAPPMTPPPIS